MAEQNLSAMRTVLSPPGIHKKFETANGEAAIASIKVLLKLHHDPHPWDDLWRAVAAEHPFRDAWWDDRNLLPLLDRVEVPVYLGCDWQNVPLHLPHTFTALQRLINSPCVRVAMVGEHGISWPWASLHYEALAWFDHWLKGRDTGVLEGAHFRYVIPQAGGWRTTDQWPLPEAEYRAFALRADGGLDPDEGEAGSRTYMNLGGGLNRPRAGDDDPPSFLTWETAPHDHDLDMIGPIELQLDASRTAPDTAFIVVLRDIDPKGHDTEITAGYLRAGLRCIDEAESEPGIPVLPCRKFTSVPVGKEIRYRIPMAPNARRFKAGHKIRLFLTTDDQGDDKPCIIGFRHASIGTSSLNAMSSSSRLLLPFIPTRD
jgi:uncharacterized protein